MSITIQTVIVTPDLERLRSFYAALFGATEVTRVPDDGPMFYLGLQVGGSTLGLVANSSIDLTAAQRMILSIDVPSVDDLLSQVISAGGMVEGPPNDMPWGQRVAHVQDPDGNAINLTQPI